MSYGSGNYNTYFLLPFVILTLQATLVEFTATGQGRFGNIQTYTVPKTGVYQIIAGGARGGKHVTDYGKHPGYDIYFVKISSWFILFYTAELI